MLKTIFKIFGVFFIIWGFFFLILNISSISTSHIEKASISKILERQSGTSYTSTNIGKANAPCKLELVLQSSGKIMVTSEEHWPCAPFIYPYYETGKIINVRTNGITVQTAGLIWEILLPLGIIAVGIAAFFVPNPKTTSPKRK